MAAAKMANTERVNVPCTPAQKRAYRAAAKRARRTLADWFRVSADEAIERELARGGGGKV